MARLDFALEWLGSISSRHTACDLSVFGRERVFQAVQQELFQRRYLGFIVHLRPKKEPRTVETLDSSVHF